MGRGIGGIEGRGRGLGGGSCIGYLFNVDFFKGF